MGLSIIAEHLFQYLNVVNCSTRKEGLEFLKEILSSVETNKPGNVDTLQEEIQSLNFYIKRLDLEVMEVLDEFTGENLLILVNTSSNKSPEKTRFYDKNTSELFSKILQACIVSKYGYVPEIECINMNTVIEKSKGAVQGAIRRLLTDNWLVSKDGKISLHIRAITEMEQMIKTNFKDHIKYCNLCKLLVIQGSSCSSCDARMHFYCAKKYFAKSKSAKKTCCPSCKDTWVDAQEDKSDDPMTDEELMEEEDISPTQTKKKRRNLEENEY